MADIVRLDKGRVNERILEREATADYRRMEQASLKRRVVLRGPESKRMFARYFHSMQLNVYYCSDIARLSLTSEQVEKVEQHIRDAVAQASKELETAIAGAQLIYQQEGIEDTATYDTVALELEVGITSAIGRQYIGLLEQFDALMPMLKTLEILDIISSTELDIKRSNLKRLVFGPAKTARRLANDLRRRASQAAKAAAEQRSLPPQDAQPPLQDGSQTDTPPVATTAEAGVREHSPGNRSNELADEQTETIVAGAESIV